MLNLFLGLQYWIILEFSWFQVFQHQTNIVVDGPMYLWRHAKLSSKWPNATEKETSSTLLAFHFIADYNYLNWGLTLESSLRLFCMRPWSSLTFTGQPGMPKWPQSPKNGRASGVPPPACLHTSPMAASAASTKKRVESLALFNRGAQRSDSRRFFAQKLFWKIE